MEDLIRLTLLYLGGDEFAALLADLRREELRVAVCLYAYGVVP